VGLTELDVPKSSQFGHPGMNQNKTELGFWAIGAPINAINALLLRAHTPSVSLVDAVQNVFEAKRFAQLLPGVGGATDLAIVASQQDSVSSGWGASVPPPTSTAPAESKCNKQNRR